MPLIILGLLLVAALSTYIVISEHPQWFVKKRKNPKDGEDTPGVIYLSGQVEDQKQKKDDE